MPTEPTIGPDPGTALIAVDELRALMGSLGPATAQTLDGHQGANRQHHRGPLIDAANDLEAVRSFLNEFADSPHTRRAYDLRSASGWLLWALIERGKPLSSLSRDDFVAYQRFLRDPQPAERWCRPRVAKTIAGVSNPAWRPFTKRLPDGTFNPQWRPFQGPLGAASVRAALSIVHSLLTYLVEANYLAGNPLALMRRRHKLGDPRPTAGRRRALKPEQWQAVQAALAAWPARTARQRAGGERAHFVCALFYFLGLRIGEAADHTMGDFVEDTLEGERQWWFEVLGKGDKHRRIPVPTGMLDALKRYRPSLGLTPLPSAHDVTALLLTLDGQRPISVSRAGKVLKAIFARAAALLEDAQPHHAETLRRASAHWLRHTYATNLWDREVDPRHIEGELGARVVRHDSWVFAWGRCGTPSTDRYALALAKPECHRAFATLFHLG